MTPADTYGPIVTVVRKLESGDTAIHKVNAAIAMMMIWFDALNGEEVVSAHIEWGDVNARDWDTSC